MEKISVDDQLICINAEPLDGNEIAPPLELGKDYPANEVHVCECGQAHINVGLLSIHNWIRCYKCDTHLPDGDRIHWCHPSRFTVKCSDNV